MNPEEMAVRLAEVDSRSKSNTKRLDKLETQTDALNSMATSLAVMAEKQETMSGDVEKVVKKVDDLAAEPGKKWRFVVEKALYIVVAAIVGFVLAKVGLT